MAENCCRKIFVVSFLCTVIGINIGYVRGQWVTPPPPGRIPVEANGRLYNIEYIPGVCKDPYVASKAGFEGGAIIKNKQVLMQKYGPFHIKGNIEIAPTGCLVIMPGTELYFNPGYGMIVNGTLIARGSYLPNQRILMTKNPNISSIVGVSSPWPKDARLVDGNTTQDGRLDLLYKGKWRGVCTNYNNFTAIDLNVTCRHLGFVYGNFTYHSFTRNETDYMLFEKPACTGSENSLFDCPGNKNIKYGATICDGQQVIGFECVGLRPDLARDHWRGLEFYNSTVDQVYNQTERLYYNASLSFLEYVDISYAGLDLYYGDGLRHALATISASPYVPMMNNITISHGAFDGLNLTEIRGKIHIANSSITHNRGYGVFIKTAVGRTLINMTNITDNWGDGIKMYLVNYTIHEFNRDFPPERSFCRTPSVAVPSFPILLHEDLIDPIGNKPVGTQCVKAFQTAPGKQLTLHVLMMERDPEASGTMEIRDGGLAAGSSSLLHKFDINNGTFPVSLTTITNEISIIFNYNVPPKPSGDPTKRCKHLRGCVRFLFELTTNHGPDIELRLYNSSVSNNTGYGVNIQDVRCKVSVNSSIISDNGYGAGLRVYQGAGEIAINNTRIERNVHAGINITYSGGYTLFNLTTVNENYGYGVITEYLRLNRTRYELMQKIEVVKSEFSFNEWTAFRVGNYCMGGQYMFNESYFSYNLHEAIEFLSCNISTKTSTNFSLAFNHFEGNNRHAVLMSPVINTVGIFTNNTFTNHKVGVIRMDNKYDFIENRWYAKFPVKYSIFENTFKNNKGQYVVNLRLTETGPFQSMEFKFNKLTYNNITDTFLYLNPRSRANAVIVVSSGNIEVQRNYIYNPDSIRDISTHLVDPSVTILCTHNWWGTVDHAFIYKRLFDQNDRYNLAELKYHPVLKSEWLYGPWDTGEEPDYRLHFIRGVKIGGIVGLRDKYIKLENPHVRTYRVDRDIIILKDAILEIPDGHTLEFESSVGMVVHGTLKADGSHQGIKFKLLEENYLPLENRTIYEKIRLVDGINEYEGRLELNISGLWGTVCDVGWIEQNSALVCQQLGLVYNPAYGRPQSQITGTVQPIWLNRVQCDELDTDIFKCRAEKYGDFVCDHTQDVFVRCQKPTWSGMAISASPVKRSSSIQQTRINHLTIEDAGLLDYADMSFSPGFRIDYNFYDMSFITVKNCVSDGINIKYSYPYTFNEIRYLTLENNLGNGILTRSPFLTLRHVTIKGNDKAGIMYDPFFTEYEALSVRNFIDNSRTVSITTTPRLQIGGDSVEFIVCPIGEAVESGKTYWMELETALYSRITVQVLDYNPLTSIEKLTLFDSRKNNIDVATRRWSVEEDLVDFPVVSSHNYLLIRYQVNGVRSGRLALAVTAVPVGKSAIHSKIFVFNATIQNNERGVVTKHYNNPSNERMEIFHRAKYEEISFDEMTVENSRKEAMFIPSLTKYHENFIPTFEEMTHPEKVGAIAYFIKNTKIINNEKGIHAEHNHVDFANNVWKWNVSYVKIHHNRNGGLEIELPRVNDMLERQFHSVEVRECELHNNDNFGFGVDGYYAVVRIFKNRFNDNQCVRGVVRLTGMEKELYFGYNNIENNFGKYGVDIDLTGHSEYSEKVTGTFEFNMIAGNIYRYISTTAGTTSTPVTYGVAIKGVQNITANRNVFDNPSLQYELVAGVTSLRLENTLNVKESYWGSTDQYKIKERIFDFDDWNNFAIAEFFPFLTSRSVIAEVSSGQAIETVLDINHLGGRIWEDLTLPARPAPYVVYSDLTVMPDVRFTLQPGTELQFHPNVGILVLGKLIAMGVPYNRIKMGPVQNAEGEYNPPLSSPLVSADLRLIGGQSPNEGFLQFFNTSTNSWNLMCDSQLNEKTGEVVCRELGLETVNVKVRFTHLYDYYVYGKPMYFIKEFWAYSYYCRGDEESMSLCMKRINYQIKPCIFAANYTFIRCGPRNLVSTPQRKMDYWGNIRFAQPDYEEKIIDHIHSEERSRLQYVDIYGGGMLHGEKVGAIQTTYVTPVMDHINITTCLFNGLDVVAPRRGFDIQKQNISGNLGYAVNILVLNGDSTESTQSSFIPLTTNTVPYNLYGLVDICKMEKRIGVRNRMILYYKYSQTAVDCVKIVQGYGGKQVAIRFLQFSLFHYDFYRNIIEIFDGEQVTPNSQLVELMANSSETEIKRRYLSTGDTLTIHIHASPSYGFYGFIAEVVTVPLSGLTYPDESHYYNIKQTIMNGNQNGALLYKNVGEINPSLMLDHCWIEGNGLRILNLTSPPIIDIGIQSSKEFNLQHSFISRNKGGTYITATTPSAATKLRANITNNVFSFNTNGEVLNLTGHHYERFRLMENYIFNNTAGDYRDIIHIQTVVVNFTFNAVGNNTGHYILRLYNTERTEATQEYQKNYFYENNATALYRALIHVGSGNPRIKHNYLVNEECDFELESNPINMLKNGAPGNSAPIDATNNWWGSQSTGYVNGKIWDALDNNSLVPVEYMPIKINNGSLIYGKCAPGWFLDQNRCYKYMGSALPFYHAQQFCRENDGFLAQVKNNQEFLRYILRLTENVYNENMRVWVFSELQPGRCSAFEKNYVVEEYDCYYIMHPFICEKDPYITPPDSSIYAAVIGIAAGVFGFAFIVILVLVLLWWIKSRRRSKEKFERATSIRSSIRGSVRSKSTMSMLTASKHRLDSFSSSKFGYDDRSIGASQLSLGGVTEDETSTDPNREKIRHLRQRAEVALGRDDRSDHSSQVDRYEDRNGHAGGRYDDRNGHINGRTRGRRYRSDDYSDEERSRKSSTHSSHHTNGGYKHSDESNEHSDHDTDMEEKRRYFREQEEEEERRRNSFTPVKFKPRLEKELDSIRIKEMNTGTVDYIRQHDDTPSVDFSDDGRHLSRSMSSFSQPGDSESNAPATKPRPPRRPYENVNDGRAPTPPAPLPLNIPARFNKTRSESDTPSPHPVPAPRPPKSVTPRNVLGSQEKLNNLSQDESVRGSQERLDDVDATRNRYGFQKAPNQENFNEPYRRRELQRSREDLHGSRENVADLNIPSAIDYLPKHDAYDLESGRDSPLHQSRENLLPKENDPEHYQPIKLKPENQYGQDMFEPNVNSSKEKLYPGRNNYFEPNIAHQRENSDSAGVDYLPRKARTPVDKKMGAFNQEPQSWDTPSASPGYRSGYQPGYSDSYSPTPSPGYQNKPGQKYHPSQFSPFGPRDNYPTETNIDSDYTTGEAGIDYLPKAGNQYRKPAQSPAARDNISRSRENLSRSRENITRSRENLSRSRENLSRSRDNLRRENDFSPALSHSTRESEILENSSDIKKPKQHKSIETEI